MINKSIQEEAKSIAAKIVEKQAERLENYATYEGEPSYRKSHLLMASELRLIAASIRQTNTPVIKHFKRLAGTKYELKCS